MQWQGNMQVPPPPPLPEVHEKTEPEAKPWWKTWITQNKLGVIAAVVIFALLYVIYPRITSMDRFAGQRLPTYMIATISIVAASGVTAINMAI